MNDEAHDMTPRLDALLERWSWDPDELSTAERTELESSPAARLAMQEIGGLAAELGDAARAERDAVLAEAVLVEAVPGPRSDELAASVQGTAPPQTTFRRWLGLAAAAAILFTLGLWAAGAFAPEPTEDTVLSGQERADFARWDAERSAVCWTTTPPSRGSIEIVLEPAEGETKVFTIKANAPAWATRAFTLDRDLTGTAFAFVVRSYNNRNLLDVRSPRISVRRE